MSEMIEMLKEKGFSSSEEMEAFLRDHQSERTKEFVRSLAALDILLTKEEIQDDPFLRQRDPFSEDDIRYIRYLIELGEYAETMRQRQEHVNMLMESARRSGNMEPDSGLCRLCIQDHKKLIEYEELFLEDETAKRLFPKRILYRK